MSAYPVLATASSFDLVGVSPHARALGGGLTAAPRDGDAAYYNPAAAAFAPHFALALDYAVAAPVLRIDGERVALEAPRGLGITLVVPRRLTDRLQIAIAVALHLPHVGVARVLLTPATDARFALLDNRGNRLALFTTAGIRWGDRVAIGAGAHFIAGVSNTTTFRIGGAAEDNNVPVATLDARLPVRIAPVVSALVKPDPRFALGLTWRGASKLDFDIAIPVTVDLQSIATGLVDIALLGLDFYTPSQLALGGCFCPPAGAIRVTADVTWVHWSGFRAWVSDLDVVIDLDTAPPVIDLDVPSPRFHDTVEVRAGAEWSGTFGATESRWALRAGYSLLPTPVPPQTGLTSIADSTRHAVSVGGGIDLAELYPVLDRPLSIDLGLGAQFLQPRLTVKDDVTGPFRSYRQGGVLWHASLGVTVRF